MELSRTRGKLIGEEGLLEIPESGVFSKLISSLLLISLPSETCSLNELSFATSGWSGTLDLYFPMRQVPRRLLFAAY